MFDSSMVDFLVVMVTALPLLAVGLIRLMERI